MTFDHVFRFNDPAGRKGSLCRIVKLTHPIVAGGERIWNTGSEPTAIEFEDGTRIMVSRSSVILAASRAGKQTIWRVRRGDTAFRRKRTEGKELR